MVDAEILAYYEHGLEQDRLAAGRQRVEFLRIWELPERLSAGAVTAWPVPGQAAPP